MTAEVEGQKNFMVPLTSTQGPVVAETQAEEAGECR